MTCPAVRGRLGIQLQERLGPRGPLPARIGRLGLVCLMGGMGEMGVISRLSGLFNHLRAFAATAQAKSGDKPPKTGDRQAIAHEGIGDSPAQTGDRMAIGRFCAKGLSWPLTITPDAVAGACRIQLRDCPWGVESAGRGTVPSSVVDGLRTALTAVCLRAGTVPRGRVESI